MKYGRKITITLKSDLKYLWNAIQKYCLEKLDKLKFPFEFFILVTIAVNISWNEVTFVVTG